MELKGNGVVPGTLGTAAEQGTAQVTAGKEKQLVGLKAGDSGGVAIRSRKDDLRRPSVGRRNMRPAKSFGM